MSAVVVTHLDGAIFLINAALDAYAFVGGFSLFEQGFEGKEVACVAVEPFAEIGLLLRHFET